jgi:hypothetical protein
MIPPHLLYKIAKTPNIFTENTPKKPKRKTLLTIATAISILLTIYTYTQSFQKVEQCGTVIAKYTKRVYYSGKRDYSEDVKAMDVLFSNGEYQTLEVSTNTYYRRNVNDRVCFKIRDEKNEQLNTYLWIGMVILTTIIVMLWVNYGLDILLW